MDDLKKHMYYFLAFMALLFIGWVLTGGPEMARQSGSSEDKFQKPLAPLDSGETYDTNIINFIPSPSFGNGEQKNPL